MTRFNIHDFSQIFGTENFLNVSNGFIAAEDMQNLNDKTAEGLLNFMRSEGQESSSNMYDLSTDTEVFTEAYAEGVRIGDYAFIFYDTDNVIKGYRPMSLFRAIA